MCHETETEQKGVERKGWGKDERCTHCKRQLHDIEQRNCVCVCVGMRSIWAYSQRSPIVRMTDNNSNSCDKRGLCCQTFITVVTHTRPNHNLLHNLPLSLDCAHP